MDRQRAAFLSQEPVIGLAVSPPRVRPGMVHSNRVGWDRTEVGAEIYQTSGGTAPGAVAVEGEFTVATRALRDAGWTVHWEVCLPPPLLDLMGNEINGEPIPLSVPRADGYEWIAAAHKIVSGVSYAALVIGVRSENTAFVDVLLRAPNARDTDNLFAPAPATPTCSEPSPAP